MVMVYRDKARHQMRTKGMIRPQYGNCGFIMPFYSARRSRRHGRDEGNARKEKIFLEA